MIEEEDEPAVKDTAEQDPSRRSSLQQQVRPAPTRRSGWARKKGARCVDWYTVFYLSFHCTSLGGWMNMQWQWRWMEFREVSSRIISIALFLALLLVCSHRMRPSAAGPSDVFPDSESRERRGAKGCARSHTLTEREPQQRRV